MPDVCVLQRGAAAVRAGYRGGTDGLWGFSWLSERLKGSLLSRGSGGEHQPPSSVFVVSWRPSFKAWSFVFHFENNTCEEQQSFWMCCSKGKMRLAENETVHGDLLRWSIQMQGDICRYCAMLKYLYPKFCINVKWKPKDTWLKRWVILFYFFNK